MTVASGVGGDSVWSTWSSAGRKNGPESADERVSWGIRASTDRVSAAPVRGGPGAGGPRPSVMWGSSHSPCRPR
jgi:hypothetical protein